MQKIAKYLQRWSWALTIIMTLIVSSIVMTSLSALEVRMGNKLAIFAPTEAVNFTLIADQAETGLTINLQIVDYDNIVHWSNSQTLTTEQSFTIPALTNGYYELHITCKDQASDNVKTNVKSFAVIPLADNMVDRDKNQFGGMVLPHVNYPMADRELDAQFMQRIGLRWVRSHRFNWSNVQKSADSNLNWQETDAEAAIYRKYGLDIIAVICWPTPGWASSGQGKGLNNRQISLMTPATEHIPALQNYCTELAKRYSNDIFYYEIGNEVDADNFWLGAYTSFLKNDKKQINNDFCQLFLTAARALKQGYPEAKVAPNTTGHVPAGDTWTPWLEDMYNLGIATEMNVFSTHYLADLEAVRQVMRKYGEPVEIILTEIGGFVPLGGKENKANLAEALRTTTAQYVMQYSHGGKAMCKFLFRDMPSGSSEPWVAGLLRADFSLRPNFVAFATLTRLLTGSDPVKELNITRNADRGWLQGFSFQKNGQDLHVIWLNDANSAQIALSSPDSTLQIIDAMGRNKIVKVEQGRINISIDMPIYILGQLTDNPGKIEYPAPTLLKTVKLDLPNADFEEPAQTGKIPGWSIITNEVEGIGSPTDIFTVSADNVTVKNRQQSLCFTATGRTNWWGAMAKIPLDQLPTPTVGQYVEVVVSYDHKGENIVGTGSGITLGFRSENMHRLLFKNGVWDRGSFDWTRRQLEKTFSHYPPTAKYVTVEFYLGQSTGKTWFDNVTVEAKLWQKSIGAIDRRN